MKTKKTYSSMQKVVKEALVVNGFTQLQLSKKMGYETPQFISNICVGKCSLPPKQFKKFSKITGIDLFRLAQAHIADEARWIEWVCDL